MEIVKDSNTPHFIRQKLTLKSGAGIGDKSLMTNKNVNQKLCFFLRKLRGLSITEFDTGEVLVEMKGYR